MNFINIYITLPAWGQLAIRLLTGSIIGGIILGFLNNIAVYKYAIEEGFRAPVEGSEYLSVLVGALSFILMIISSTISCNTSFYIYFERSKNEFIYSNNYHHDNIISFAFCFFSFLENRREKGDYF